MDENYIESLIDSAQNGDDNAKIQIISEFDPFIKSLSKKTFIHGYTEEDIHSQCIVSLLQCIEKYNSDRYCFVGYCTNGIKNNLYETIRKQIKNSKFHKDALTSTGCLDDEPLVNAKDSSYEICLKEDMKKLSKIIKTLNDDEIKLFEYIFLENNSVRSYANFFNIPYTTVYQRYRKLKTKLKFEMKK